MITFYISYLILPSVTTSLFRVFICTNEHTKSENKDEYNYYLNADVILVKQYHAILVFIMKV